MPIRVACQGKDMPKDRRRCRRLRRVFFRQFNVFILALWPIDFDLSSLKSFKLVRLKSSSVAMNLRHLVSVIHSYRDLSPVEDLHTTRFHFSFNVWYRKILLACSASTEKIFTI